MVLLSRSRCGRRSSKKIRPTSLPELAKITAGMPAQYQAMILLASWCALRFGELAELRRRDVVLDADKRIGVIRIDRAVVRIGDGFQVTPPKSDAGTRDVAVPPHLVPVIQEHLATYVGLMTTRCCSRLPTVGTWRPARSTALSTRPAMLLGARTYGSTTCVSQAPCWRPLRVPRSPS